MCKELKVKRLSDTAILPTKTNSNDAAFDLYADEDKILYLGEQELISTSIAMEIPDGYAGFIWPRSGMSAKHGIDVLAGVIDAGYRGEIKVCLLYNNEANRRYTINKGDRIAQIVIQKIPKFYIKEVEELSNSERDNNGFGSSGK